MRRRRSVASTAAKSTASSLNDQTLEIDLFEDGFRGGRDRDAARSRFGPQRSALIDGWEADPDSLDQRSISR